MFYHKIAMCLFSRPDSADFPGGDRFLMFSGPRSSWPVVRNDQQIILQEGMKILTGGLILICLIRSSGWGPRAPFGRRRSCIRNFPLLYSCSIYCSALDSTIVVLFSPIEWMGLRWCKLHESTSGMLKVVKGNKAGP